MRKEELTPVCIHGSRFIEFDKDCQVRQKWIIPFWSCFVVLGNGKLVIRTWTVFCLGSNGRGITILFLGYATGGKLCCYTIA